MDHPFTSSIDRPSTRVAAYQPLPLPARYLVHASPDHKRNRAESRTHR